MNLDSNGTTVAPPSGRTESGRRASRSSVTAFRSLTWLTQYVSTTSNNRSPIARSNASDDPNVSDGLLSSPGTLPAERVSRRNRCEDDG